MLHATLKVLADLGDAVGPVEGAAAIAEIVKCMPVKAQAWPFGPRERAAGVRWEDVAALDAAGDEEGEEGRAGDANGLAAGGARDENAAAAVSASGVAFNNAGEADSSLLAQTVPADNADGGAESDLADADGLESAAASLPSAKPLGLRATLLHQPLWDASDAKACENWERVFVPSIASKLPELRRDIARARAARPWLEFSRVDVVCDRFTVGVPCDEAGELGDVVAALEQVRQLLAQGALGSDPVRIDRLSAGGWRAVAADGTAEVL